jgi:hypothetical protein
MTTVDFFKNIRNLHTPPIVSSHFWMNYNIDLYKKCGGGGGGGGGSGPHSSPWLRAW